MTCRPRPLSPSLFCDGERDGVRGSSLLCRDFLGGHYDERTQGDENTVLSSYRLARSLSKATLSFRYVVLFQLTHPDAVAYREF